MFMEHESMIWFALSYMKGGEAELWANAYVDRALEDNDWGMWEAFLDQLAKDFGSTKEPRKALEEMGKLAQGKWTAAEYFLKFEQLASVVGMDVNRYPNATLYIEKNIHHVLINQLYQSDVPPQNYQDYKRRVIAMDEMRRCQDAHRTYPQATPVCTRESNAMEVDRTAKQDEQRCFICAKEGHLAWACQEKEKRQGF
jgi:hypothetical protein